jgi:hypothetical protein
VQKKRALHSMSRFHWLRLAERGIALGPKRLQMLPMDNDTNMHAGPMRLEQVITNLLLNAAKSSPPDSKVMLIVAATPERNRITLRKQGVGIDAANKARVFDSFSELDKSDTHRFSSTGIGSTSQKGHRSARRENRFPTNRRCRKTFFDDHRCNTREGETSSQRGVPRPFGIAT